jgi:hypothetical protein
VIMKTFVCFILLLGALLLGVWAEKLSHECSDLNWRQRPYVHTLTDMQADVQWLKTTLTNNALAVNGSFDGIAKIFADHKQMLDQHQTNILLLHHALMNHGHKTNK